jgi:hypothetical protein
MAGIAEISTIGSVAPSNRESVECKWSSFDFGTCEYRSCALIAPTGWFGLRFQAFDFFVELAAFRHVYEV